MEIVKKFGLWIVAAIIAIAAVAVYFLFVHTVDDQVKKKRTEIEQRRNDLKTWADKGNQIPNLTKIDNARKNAEQVAALLDQCELYLAQQPRWAQTIRFFTETEGPYGPETEVPLSQPYNWLKLYREHCNQLQAQLAEAGINYTVKKLDFGTRPPEPDGIASAMVLYWFQKDLVDFLTQQVEKDLAAYLEFKATDRADPFPAKPYDLVVNRSPGRLDEFLRAQKREKLVAVLGAITVNRQQQDLATIFNTLLPDGKKPDGSIEYDGFPWERPASEKEHPSVRGLTMDDAQEKFLAEMLPPGKPDLSNRQRFLDYVMELRMVRYRADVVGLLESHHFDSLAASLRKGTEAELNGILNDIADVNGVWNTTRIAEAISAIVSINDENDFLLVRNNHAPDIASLISMTVENFDETVNNESGEGRRRSATAPSAPANDLYELRGFTMEVALDFERIPVFLRRLMNNSWRYRVEIMGITPVLAPAARGGMPGAMGAMGAVGAPVASGQPGQETVETGNYVLLKLTGQAYQFTPLLAKYKDKIGNLATPAAPASAGAPAAPGGGR